MFFFVWVFWSIIWTVQTLISLDRSMFCSCHSLLCFGPRHKTNMAATKNIARSAVSEFATAWNWNVSVAEKQQKSHASGETLRRFWVASFGWFEVSGNGRSCLDNEKTVGTSYFIIFFLRTSSMFWVEILQLSRRVHTWNKLGSFISSRQSYGSKGNRITNFF